MKQENSSANPLNGKIYATILTMIILVIGTFFYFTAINNPTEMSIKSQKSIEQKQMTSNDNPVKINSETSISINSNSQKKSMDSQSSSEITQNSNSLFNRILKENKVFTKINTEGYVKLFYYYPVNKQTEIILSEGNINDYEIHTIAGQNYYPLILGSEEAKIMRQEGLFTDIGDPIKNFFGKNVVIVGIMKETGSVLDTIHLIPLNSRELN